MADLRSCYFCGEGPNESLQEHGVVPSAFDPTDDQQRSVVLCPDCGEKLTAVMRAAVEASGAGDTTDANDAGATTDANDAGGTTPQSPSDGSGGGAGGGAGDAATEPAADSGGTGGSADDGTAADDAAGGTTPDPLSEATPEDRAESARSGLASGAGTDDGTADAGENAATREGSTTDDDDRPGDVAHEPDDDEEGITRTQGTGVSFNTATAGDDDVEGGDDDDEAAPQRETGAASVDSSAGVDVTAGNSEAYRQVIRLLQNREFPVQRNEIAEVAASAYQLSPSETRSAIDAIVQKGLLVEENGVLRRSPTEE